MSWAAHEQVDYDEFWGFSNLHIPQFDPEDSKNLIEKNS